MSTDHEFRLRLTHEGPSYFDMDDAFCARMRKAIATGRESAPIGVVTTPGTKNPKYVPTEQVVHRQDDDFSLLIKLVQA
jgi:hypothetical protein